MAAEECEALAVWSVATICRELSLQNVRNVMRLHHIINLHVQLIGNAKSLGIPEFELLILWFMGPGAVYVCVYFIGEADGGHLP